VSKTPRPRASAREARRPAETPAFVFRRLPPNEMRIESPTRHSVGSRPRTGESQGDPCSRACGPRNMAGLLQSRGAPSPSGEGVAKPLAPEGRGVGVRGEAGNLSFRRRPAPACAATEPRPLPFATSSRRGNRATGVMTFTINEMDGFYPPPDPPPARGRELLRHPPQEGSTVSHFPTEMGRTPGKPG
jgi:hypothetical protein